MGWRRGVVVDVCVGMLSLVMIFGYSCFFSVTEWVVLFIYFFFFV